jgi:hypothetical protein
LSLVTACLIFNIDMAYFNTLEITKPLICGIVIVIKLG